MPGPPPRMTDSPVFSRIDADRILQRAAEIEGAEDSRRLTLRELRSIAGEAGFGPRAVDRAIAEARSAPPPDVRRLPVHRSGFVVTHLSTAREVPTGIDSEQLTRVVRLFQPYREGPPQVELDEREITWRDRKGLRFTVTSAGGITEIRVFVSKVLVRRGRWTSWVKSAADRLEMLVRLVAAQDAPDPGDGSGGASPSSGVYGADGGRTTP